MKLSIVAVSLFSLSSSVYVDAQEKLQKKSSKKMKSHGALKEVTVAPTIKETTTAPEPPPPPPPPPSPPVFRAVAPVNNQYDVCTDFCKGAVTVCEGVVDWVTNTYATPYTRHLDGGAGTAATGQPEEQFGACHNTCMRWVYWREDHFITPPPTRFNLAHNSGDSLNCRINHLQFATASNTQGLFASESDRAQHHCMHLTQDGGWICSESRNAENKTPEQLYKEAMFTKHKVGDCWLAADDKIADCHYKGLTDATVDQNLLWLPDDVEYIFLLANLLTKVPDLSRFTELKGIFLKNNAIDTLTSNDFAANTKLEVLSLEGNFITVVPPDLIAANTELKIFNTAFNYMKDVPQTLFATNKELQAINLAFQSIKLFESGTFDGLTKLKLLSFGVQAKYLGPVPFFTEDSIPDGLFDDLVSLEYLSFFDLNIGVIKEKWFGDWSAKVEGLSIFGQRVPAMVIEDGVFDKLPNLLDLASQNNGNIINPSDVPNNPQLTVLYGDGTAILAPLPKPDLFNVELL